jgi:Rrf2 family protein
MFSKACEYAIKIMIYIATNEQLGKRTGLKEVSESTGSPEAYTAKILQRLVKGDLLESHRGPNGGFDLPNKKIWLHDIVSTIDGKHLLNDCVLGLDECSGKTPCPVHDHFSIIKNQITETLLSTHIQDEQFLNGSMRLKN